MAQNNIVTLRCKQTGEVYTTRVSKKARRGYANPNFKLKLKKYSRILRKVVEFVETKKFGSTK